MKRYILLVIILIFLVGCDIYNLNCFVMPDDIEFLNLVEELDTPQKIGDYMLENFTLKVNTFYATDPYTLWKTKRGDCNDFATFGMFIANWHGYETYLIRIFYSDTFDKHAIAVYIEDNGLSFTDNRLYFNNNGFYFNLFREVVDWDSDNITFLNWRRYKIYDYWNEIIEEEFK